MARLTGPLCHHPSVRLSTLLPYSTERYALFVPVPETIGLLQPFPGRASASRPRFSPRACGSVRAFLNSSFLEALFLLGDINRELCHSTPL